MSGLDAEMPSRTGCCQYNVRRYEANGATRWTRRFDPASSGAKYPCDCAALSDGSLVVVGGQSQSDGMDTRLYDENGVEIWSVSVAEYLETTIGGGSEFDSPINGSGPLNRGVSVRADDTIVVWLRGYVGDPGVSGWLFGVELDPADGSVIGYVQSANSTALLTTPIQRGYSLLNGSAWCLATANTTIDRLFHWPASGSLSSIALEAAATARYYTDVAFHRNASPAWKVGSGQIDNSGNLMAIINRTGLLTSTESWRDTDSPGTISGRGGGGIDADDDSYVYATDAYWTGSAIAKLVKLDASDGSLVDDFGALRTLRSVRVCHGSGNNDVVRFTSADDRVERWTAAGAWSWSHIHADFRNGCSHADGSFSAVFYGLASIIGESSFVAE